MQKASKIIFLILKILLIVALIGVNALIIFLPPQETTITDFNLGPNKEPDYANTVRSGVVSELDNNDANSQIQLAGYLYALANANYKNCDGCLYAVDCQTEMTIKVLGKEMKMNVNGYRYQLKTDNEYYYTEYSVAPGSIGKIMQLLNLQVENTMYAIRSYTNTDMDYLYSEKSLSPSFVTDEEGNLTITRNWNAENMVNGYEHKQTMPIYNKTQSDVYMQTAQTINERTIKDAKITYHKSAEGNYYKMILTLDTELPETTELSIGGLRAGAGDSAYYTEMIETIEIWENGYYKSFLSVDKWTDAKLMDSVITYATTFYYDKEHLNTSIYMDFDDVKQIATNYNSAK